MSTKEFLGQKAAIVIENGCCEREIIQAFSAMEGIGLSCHFIASQSDIVKSWNEDRRGNTSDWASDYAANARLNNAYPSNYSALVIPGGRRSIEKLKLDPSLRSFISGFLHTDKPVIAYNFAIEILSDLDLVKGYSVAAAYDFCDNIRERGGYCAQPEFIVSKNLITLSRYRDAEDRISAATTCVLNGEVYVDKVVSSENMPRAAHIAA
ncbi:MAG: DJ-1/PfpI family protein [Alphaproteobacteria bacterium]